MAVMSHQEIYILRKLRVYRSGSYYFSAIFIFIYDNFRYLECILILKGNLKSDIA